MSGVTSTRYYKISKRKKYRIKNIKIEKLYLKKTFFKNFFSDFFSEHKNKRIHMNDLRTSINKIIPQ
jgi:hypothetical protein